MGRTSTGERTPRSFTLDTISHVLVPVQADYLAAEDMTELVGTVRSIQRQIVPPGW